MVTPAPGTPQHYDVLVVGSGFGGSVAALRLTEKGYRVGVLEAGKRFADSDFPTTSWQVRDYLFAPALGCYGIFRPTLLGDVLVLTGAGVGGGSLGYANTLYRPPAHVFAQGPWAGITDWADELAPFYDQATRVLGVHRYPRTSRADEVMEKVAAGLGVGETFHLADVGVTFGPEGSDVGDPYFGGVGPRRTACTHCGACMTGCRVGAKNTTVKNYLHLAERAGAEVHALTTVRDVRERPGGGYVVTTEPTGARGPRRRTGRRTWTADRVVLAAGALGTAKLLHRLREDGSLPRVSARVGMLTRTNSEAILQARSRSRDVDFTDGVAITSSFHTDPHTHVEPVRYGRGSNLLGLLGAVLVDGEPDGRSRRGRRLARAAREAWRQRRDLRLIHDPRHWSEQAIAVLVMQSLDNSITTGLRRLPWGQRVLTSRQGEGEPNPAWIPAAHEVARRAAEEIGGVPGGSLGDLVDVPLTGHLIGGCTIGPDADHGVVDAYHRLFGHEGISVVDGSTVSTNLGVNPSLTITAQAERAFALWPNKGEPDPRPAPGEAYRRLAPVPPRAPVVPAGAPGALLLPVPAVPPRATATMGA